MAINKKLIHFKLKSSFETELANNNLLDTSIVFIQETKEIWTHGQLYKCSDPDLSNYVKESELQELLSPIQSSLANKLEVSDLAGYAKTSDIPAVVTDSTVSNGGFMKTSDANETYAPKSLVETVSNQATTISTLATKNELSTGLAGKLDNAAASGFVPTTRKVNGVALDQDITITATDPNAATKEELNGLATTVANKADVSALANFATTDALSSGLSGKQETLVSGTNIKTVNGQSILGNGNIEIGGDSGSSDSYLNVYRLDTTSFDADGMATLSQEQMDGIIAADAVLVGDADTSVILSKTRIPDINVIILSGIPTHLLTLGEPLSLMGVIISTENNTASLIIEEIATGATGGAGGAGGKELIEYNTDTMNVSSNVYCRNTNTTLSTLTIRLNATADNNILNEYFIEFTTSNSGTAVSLPSSIKWANGEIPSFEASMTYQISIINNLGIVQKFE